MEEKTVDYYLSKQNAWKDELALLREITVTHPLVETIKWGAPTYAYHKSNVMGLAAFKNYVGIWFFQGALLDDPSGRLMNAQEGKTKALRQMRFTSIDEIESATAQIHTFINSAITLAKEGKKVVPQKGKPLTLPLELQEALASDPALSVQFDAFSLSKRREFATHVGSAKREATRLARLAKVIPMIQNGLGLHDKYRK